MSSISLYPINITLIIKESRLIEVATAMKDPVKGIKLKDKRYFLKAYAKCFTGNISQSQYNSINIK